VSDAEFIAAMDVVIEAMDNLARAYRRTNGLDGAWDEELRVAEEIITEYKAAKAAHDNPLTTPKES
jgi:hypothetical protein